MDDTSLFAPPPDSGTELNRVRQQPNIPPNQVGGGAVDEQSLFAPPPPVGTGSVGAVTAATGGGTPDSVPTHSADPLFAPPPSDAGSVGPGDSVYKEIANRHWWDRPVLGAEPTTSAEIEQIARKHGVDPQQLQEIAPYFGARMSETGGFFSAPELRRGAGAMGSLALGLPQKLYKLTQTPEMSKALDEVQELASGRSSYLQKAGELATPIGGVAREAGLASKLAAGGAVGATAGFAGSQTGHELAGTALGAGAGVALGGVGAGVEKLLAGGATRRAERAAVSEAERTVDRVAQRGGADFSEGVRQAVAERRNATDIIRDHVFSDAEQLTPEQASTVAREYSPHTVEDLLDRNTEAGTAFLEKHAGETTEALQQIATQDVADTVIRNSVGDLAQDVFKRRIAQSDDPRAMLRAWAGQAERSGQGPEYARQRLENLLNARTAEKYVVSKGIAQGEAPSFLQKGLDWLSDAQYVFRNMDEKWRGLGAEAAHKEINSGVNRMSFPREDFRQQLGTVFNELRRAGVDAEARDGAELISKVESGTQLSPSQEAAWKPFQQYFSEGLTRINKIAEEEGLPPLAIKERPNYIPAQLIDAPQLRERVSERVNAIVRDAERLSGERYSDVAAIPDALFNRVVNESPEHSSTLQFMHMLSGETGNKPADVSLMWKNTFLNPEGRQRLETVARAALEREDRIPLWARETNMYKLADKWATNSLRHLYLRQGIDHMRNVAHMLHNLGAESQAQYAERLLADLMGTRKGTAAEYFSRAQDTFHQAIDRRIRSANSEYQRQALRTLKAIPTMLQDLSKQVYPNLLGANPRSLIMNLTQSLTKTLPEFGGPYGSLLMFRGAARIGGIRNLPAYMRRMESMGLAPRRFVGGSLNYLDEGLMRSEGAQLARKGLRAVGETAMKPYEWAESVNRGISFGASEMLANDLVRGSKLAESSLMRMPTSVRNAVQQARADGDVGEMVRVIATHVINSTQYQYNRASMSEYGRTMGPLFSAFSKWPTATLGQAVEAYRTGGAIKGSAKVAEQLVAPWLLLQVADHVMGENSDRGLSDRQKKLFGATGFSQSAPIGNLGGIATGDFFTPPAIDTAMRTFLAPARSKDQEQAIDKMRKALENGAYMFAPGGVGGWIRFITDDLTTLVTGERPEGSTQLERSMEGARRMGLH